MDNHYRVMRNVGGGDTFLSRLDAVKEILAVVIARVQADVIGLERALEQRFRFGVELSAAGKWHLGNAAKVNFDTIAGGGPSGCENWVKTLQQRPKDKPFLPDTTETRRDLAMYYDEVTRMDSFIGKVLDELDSQGIADNTFVLFLSDNGRPFPRCKTTVYDSGVKTPFVIRFPGRVKPRTVCD